MIKLLSKDKINKHFNDGQIQAYMREFNLTEQESILYLYFFNNAHITLYDFKKDCGRPMFIKFAKTITNFIEEFKNDY